MDVVSHIELSPVTEFTPTVSGEECGAPTLWSASFVPLLDSDSMFPDMEDIASSYCVEPGGRPSQGLTESNDDK